MGFNEFGKYVATHPYISDQEQRRKVIAEAVDKARKLSIRLYEK